MAHGSGQNLKQNLTDKQSILARLQTENEELRIMTQSMSEVEKSANLKAAVEKALSDIPESIAFITELDSEKDMENIRNFVGVFCCLLRFLTRKLCAVDSSVP